MSFIWPVIILEITTWSCLCFSFSSASIFSEIIQFTSANFQQKERIECLMEIRLWKRKIQLEIAGNSRGKHQILRQKLKTKIYEVQGDFQFRLKKKKERESYKGTKLQRKFVCLISRGRLERSSKVWRTGARWRLGEKAARRASNFSRNRAARYAHREINVT